MNNENENGVGEVETVSNKTAIQPLQSNTQIDLSTPEGVELQTRRIEKFMEAQGRIRRACVQMTNIHDWIDQEGKPYLQWTGTSKIASAFGVSYDTPRWTEKIRSDDLGEYVEFVCESIVRYAGRCVPEIGSANTRDSFFAVRTKFNPETKVSDKYFLPISEIDINDIKKKALTNLLNRGLKSLLGMSFSWDEIAQATNGAITQEKCVSVKHAKGTQGGKTDTNASTSADRGRVWTMLLEICGGEEAGAVARLKKLTEWKNKEGQIVPGKSKIQDVSEAMMKHLVPKVEAEYKTYTDGMGQKAPAPEAGK